MTLPTPPSPAAAHAGFQEPEPAWDIARLFPAQGTWSVQEYLGLGGNRLVEFTNGFVEVLAMPTMVHQLIVLFLCDVLRAHVRGGRPGAPTGAVLISPFRIRLGREKYREPDVMFMRSENAARMKNEFWNGADLVMEVVSDDDRRRDLEIKRFEYARAGIPEYWIVDPRDRRITVLKLGGRKYAVQGEYDAGATAASALLAGFEVDVAAVFAVGR